MTAPTVDPETVAKLGERLTRIDEELRALSDQIGPLAAALSPEPEATRLQIFHEYIAVAVAAFVVTLLVTPLMRRLAVANGIIDKPLEGRKVHRFPIAYLGGVAVFAGIFAGIFLSFTAPVHGLVPVPSIADFTDTLIPGGVPPSILLGMTVIMLVGLIDDVVGIRPSIKIAGQLVAAAALAVGDVGVKLAAQILKPVGQLLNNPELVYVIPAPAWFFGGEIPVDVVYWAGTGIIAVFVLGACNASNLIDGLDGLLTGVTAIVVAGLLVIALSMAVHQDGPLDPARIVLCLALLGACLGFLPHNFNPASIFLGDCGSMLIGYCTIVIILTLGDTGRTDLVLAGLIIYAIPLIDTALAIIRRKVAGKSISEADDQHIHHMLKRALGVKGAVLTLYLIGAGFAALGVALSEGRGRITYAITLVFAAFIVITAFKVARRDHIREQAINGATSSADPSPAAAEAPSAPAPARASPQGRADKPGESREAAERPAREITRPA